MGACMSPETPKHAGEIELIKQYEQTLLDLTFRTSKHSLNIRNKE